MAAARGSPRRLASKCRRLDRSRRRASELTRADRTPPTAGYLVAPPALVDGFLERSRLQIEEVAGAPASPYPLGVTEAELEADPRRSMRLFRYALSGDAPPDLVPRLFTERAPSGRVLDRMPEPASCLAGSAKRTSTSTLGRTPLPVSAGRSACTATNTATGTSIQRLGRPACGSRPC